MLYTQAWMFNQQHSLFHACVIHINKLQWYRGSFLRHIVTDAFMYMACKLRCCDSLAQRLPLHNICGHFTGPLQVLALHKVLKSTHTMTPS